MHTQPSSTRRGFVAAAIPVGILLSGLLVWQASYAAFSATTTNPSNSWVAGQVALSDNDSGTAMFSATGLKPGSTDTTCITVTYDGDLAANVDLYIAGGGLTGTLGTYLDLTVEEGTTTDPSLYGDCTGFVAAGGSTTFSNTLASFGGTHTSFATGWGTWAPTGATQTRVYRFTYTLQDDNNAQGASATATFTWEAQNT